MDYILIILGFGLGIWAAGTNQKSGYLLKLLIAILLLAAGFFIPPIIWGS